jgi:ABC-type transport system substrate-binding protein
MNCPPKVLLTALSLILGGAVRAPAVSPEVPHRGGTLRLSLPDDLRSLDPAIAYDSDSAPLAKLAFRGLLNFGDGTDLVPDQAADWSVSSDGKTYTFHLQSGVHFSNGREVEAADYVFTFERILDPKISSPGASFFLCIAGAPEFVAGKAPHVSGLRAPDRRTLVIKLSEPVFTFRYVMAMNFADVVPREVVRKEGANFQYHLVGSGPYQVAEWRRGVCWKFVRNPFYNGPDGYADVVDVMIGADDTTATMMLERGQLDSVLASPAEAIRFKRDPRLRSWLVLADTISTDYLFMNAEMKPFDDVRVRQAVSHAIHKERLLRLTGGFNAVAHGIVPPVLGWANPRRPADVYDPGQSRALLRAAGFPNGFRTDLWYMGNNAVLARLAEGAQQDLEQVGIKAALRPLDAAVFQVKAGARHSMAMGIWGWFADYPDPSNFLDVLFNGEHISESDCNNVSFYSNPRANRLLDSGVDSVRPDDRVRDFREAEALILNDAPWVPLIHEQLPLLYAPRVHGCKAHPVWVWRWEKVWLDPG